MLSLSMVGELGLGSVDSLIGSDSPSDTWAFSTSEGSLVWLSSSSSSSSYSLSGSSTWDMIPGCRGWGDPNSGKLVL